MESEINREIESLKIKRRWKVGLDPLTSCGALVFMSVINFVNIHVCNQNNIYSEYIKETTLGKSGPT